MDNNDPMSALEEIANTVVLEVECDMLKNQAMRLRKQNARLVEHVRDLESVMARMMRLLFLADGVSLPLVEPTEARLNTSPLLAPIWRNVSPTGDAFYEFGLLRETTFGDAVPRFRPEEVLKLPYLIQQLASYFCGIDSLDPALRDDLSCLACCLEDFLGIKRCPHRLNDREQSALALVIESLGHEEKQHHREDPSDGPLFDALKTLKTWFDAAINHAA